MAVHTVTDCACCSKPVTLTPWAIILPCQHSDPHVYCLCTHFITDGPDARSCPECDAPVTEMRMKNSSETTETMAVEEFIEAIEYHEWSMCSRGGSGRQG